MKLYTSAPVLLPPDVYEGRCTDAEIQEGGEWGPQVKVTYLVDHDGDERRLTYWAKLYTKVTPKAKIAKLFAAHLGRPLSFDPPEPLDIEDLIGKSVRLFVIVKDAKDGGQINSVSEVTATRSTAPATTAALPLDGDPYAGE